MTEQTKEKSKKKKHGKKLKKTNDGKFNFSKGKFTKPIQTQKITDEELENDPTIITGDLNVIKDQFAFVDTPTEGIFIPKKSFGGAFDGDTVAVRIVEGRGGKKEGIVVKVIKRNRETIVGIVQIKENFGFVVPVHSFGNDIFIPKNAMKKNMKNGDLVVAKITFWGDEKRKPEGIITEIIGDSTDTDNMIKGLIETSGMSEEFPEEVLAEARNIPTVVTQQEIAQRKDLRKLKIITIDGDDAKDLDDAVYVEKLSDGYKLIVAIADVGHYIPVNSKLDIEAQKRGNSVYLVDRVLPMFPHEISNGICSLNEREDKLTFSCEIIFDKNGKVISSEIYKSVINTVHRMTYNNVNKIIAKDEWALKEYSDILEEVATMVELSHLIRQIKYNRGSIDFDIPECKVILDKDKHVIEVKKIERGDSEKIIEDFMIAANEAIAEKLFWLEVPSIYRTHDKPDIERITTLNEILGKFGYRIKGNILEIHPKEFQKIIEDSKEKGLSMIVHKTILMSLKQARYTKENTGHFGLSSTYYTHFTSPIRRYADLMIHRICNLTLKGYPDKKSLKWLNNSLDGICFHISKTERDAMKVEDESKKIKIVDYMKDKLGNEYEAIIIGFSPKKIFFETEENIECFFDVVASPEDYFEYDEHAFKMTGKNTGKVYNLGDKLKVTIAKVNVPMLEIEVVPVPQENKK